MLSQPSPASVLDEVEVLAGVADVLDANLLYRRRDDGEWNRFFLLGFLHARIQERKKTMPAARMANITT
jgi:hypothetical protein